MSSSDDTSHHPWKRAAWSAREMITDALVAIPNSYPRDRTVLVSEEHELLHDYLLEYHAIVEPRSDEIEVATTGTDDSPGLWTEPLVQVSAPVRAQEVQLGADEQSDVLRSQNSDREVLAAFYGDLEFEERVIKLGSLVETWQVNNTVTVRLEGWVENQGRVERSISTPLHIPVGAASVLRKQLDKCLEEMGWLPEMDRVPRTEIGPELIDLVEEWKEETVPDDILDQWRQRIKDQQNSET